MRDGSQGGFTTLFVFFFQLGYYCIYVQYYMEQCLEVVLIYNFSIINNEPTNHIIPYLILYCQRSYNNNKFCIVSFAIKLRLFLFMGDIFYDFLYVRFDYSVAPFYFPTHTLDNGRNLVMYVCCIICIQKGGLWYKINFVV